MRSSYRFRKYVASIAMRPLASSCSTPASRLRLRSGASEGLSVNASSNASGGRMPVPAFAFRRVCTRRPSVIGTATQFTASFGFHDSTVSSSKGGRGDHGSPLPASARRVMCSTRSPADANSRPPVS